jgi:hypothetical protein
MLVENVTFRLRAGADEVAFLEADKAVQIELVSSQAGFLRRTTARAVDGEWLVASLWRSARHADAFNETAKGDPLYGLFASFVDAETMQSKRYTTLD